MEDFRGTWRTLEKRIASKISKIGAKMHGKDVKSLNIEVEIKKNN